MFVTGKQCLIVLAILMTGCARREKLAASIPPAPGAMHTQYTMRYVDVAIGTGKAAEAGKVFSVHYTGWLLDGTKFDSSREKKPLSFEQGKGKVIPGWDAGFEGMRVGGKRRLFIPLSIGVRREGARQDSA
jgi:peptidylprolyl isomerase